MKKVDTSQRLQLAQLAVASLSAHERTEFMRVLTGAPVAAEPDKILRPRGAAVRLGVTPRTVFNLLKAGALTRITLPGRQRGVGVRESEITAIVEGKAVNSKQ